ncbi:MAG: YvcK family protein [Bryobacterales bacterium]|nr:YvcK family protein [Bryobacterales bacterium]
MAGKRGSRQTAGSGQSPSASPSSGPALITGVNLEEPLRILVVGGGTGLSSILAGLKCYARPELRREPHPDTFALPEGMRAELTAVVTVTDDGGSSGRLRREFDVLPPGDIRNCMVALSEDATLLSRLFQYRFSSGEGLKGHSFGNLFLTVLTQLTGDFAHAIKVSSEVLAIAGKIYPSTASKVELRAKLANGREVKGETNISKSRSPIERVFIHPKHVQPLPETLDAIAKADLICLGPGSLFTSVIPNLLVDGVPEAIRRSPAVKAYLCNLMWQPGETMHFRASDHVKAIHEHAGCELVDCVIVNTAAVGSDLRTRYAAQKARPVEVDAECLIDMGLRLVEGELLAETDKVRHHPERAAALAVRMALMARKQRQRAEVLRPATAKAGN